MGQMEKILRLMSERKASDVYLSAASPVQMKINGVCAPITPQPLPVDGPLQLLAEVVSTAQLQEFHASGELNVAIPLSGAGRFRLSAMKQRGNCAVVARFISSEIPAFESLQLPPVLAKMIMAKRGLMLVVGSTGSGKSTTLAA
ncbi:MAG: type IV pili twitching motility protein PilT, partial [Serpentinimonas sp.]|nr:type IV pili twitching motility protein PilT [Serpentinimonas sp.]